MLGVQDLRRFIEVERSSVLVFHGSLQHRSRCPLITAYRMSRREDASLLISRLSCSVASAGFPVASTRSRYVQRPVRGIGFTKLFLDHAELLAKIALAFRAG